MEILIQKLGHILLANNVSTKTIQLGEGDSSKTALIEAGLEDK